MSLNTRRHNFMILGQIKLPGTEEEDLAMHTQMVEYIRRMTKDQDFKVDFGFVEYLPF